MTRRRLRSLRSPLAACLLAAACSAPVAAGDPENPNGDGEDAPEAPLLEARPQYLSLHSQVRFDDDGEVRERDHAIQLQVTVSLPDQQIYAYRVGEAQSVITSSDESLEVTPQHVQLWRDIPRSRRRDGRGVHVRYQLEPPSIPAAALRSVRGEVVFLRGAGGTRRHVVGPIEQIAGERVELPDLENAHATVQRRKDGVTRIELKGEAWHRLHTVEAIDGDGKVLQRTSHYGAAHLQGTRKFIAFRSIPPESRLVFKLWNQSQRLRRRFEVLDVSLPAGLEEPPLELTRFAPLHRTLAPRPPATTADTAHAAPPDRRAADDPRG